MVRKLPRVTNCANVDFVFGNGIMDTIPSNNRSCTTNGETSHAANVMVTKDRCDRRPCDDGAGCGVPDHRHVHGARTARNGQSSAILPRRARASAPPCTACRWVTRCTVHEPSPSLPPGTPSVPLDDELLLQRRPGGGVPGDRPAAAISPSNVFGVRIRACMRNAAAGALRSGHGKSFGRAPASASTPACEARRADADPVRLPRGHGVWSRDTACVGPEKSCPETDEHWNGHSCVACAHGGEWDNRLDRCVKKEACDNSSTITRGGACLCRYPAMTQTSSTQCMCPQGSALRPGVGCAAVAACHDPMTLNAAGTACVCPQGTKPKDGTLREEEFVLRQHFQQRSRRCGAVAAAVAVAADRADIAAAASPDKPAKPPVDNGPVPH